MIKQYPEVPSSILCMVLCSFAVEQKLWGSKGISFLSSFVLSLGVMHKMGLWWSSKAPASRNAIMQATFCITIQKVSSCMEIWICIIKKNPREIYFLKHNFSWCILLSFSWKIALQVTSLKCEQMDNS